MYSKLCGIMWIAHVKKITTQNGREQICILLVFYQRKANSISNFIRIMYSFKLNSVCRLVKEPATFKFYCMCALNTGVSSLIRLRRSVLTSTRMIARN